MTAHWYTPCYKADRLMWLYFYNLRPKVNTNSPAQMRTDAMGAQSTQHFQHGYPRHLEDELASEPTKFLGLWHPFVPVSERHTTRQAFVVDK